MDTEDKAYAAVAALAAERDHYRAASALLDRMQRPRVIVINDGQGVCVGGPFDGWLMSKHTDGQWVSLRRLDQDDRPESSGPSIGRGSECRVTPHVFVSRDLKA